MSLPSEPSVEPDRHVTESAAQTPVRAWPIALSALVVILGSAVAIWISFGRGFFGASGELTSVFAFTMMPLFAIVQYTAALWILLAAIRGFRIFPRTIVFLCLSWFTGFAFGMMVPDNVQGEVVSAFSNLMSTPENQKLALEFAIGFSNPLGILAIGVSVVAAVLAWVDSRGRRLPSRDPYRNLS